LSKWNGSYFSLPNVAKMNETIQAIILGIVQGLTEFLPVSSSGHLEIAKFIMNDTSVAEESMMMTVVLHFATALSTLVIFRKEVMEIITGLFQFEKNEHFWFAVKIVISMIPAVIIGIGFEDEIESLFDKKLVLVGAMLVVTGVLLFLADRAKNTEKSVGMWQALVIGISQAIAILPGISRSGATISTSVLLGIDRSRAAKFSFLMVVPLIFGKMAKEILDSVRGEEAIFDAAETVPLICGFVAAFLTGMLACTWMIKLVKASKLYYFSIYCFVVAAFAIAKGLELF